MPLCAPPRICYAGVAASSSSSPSSASPSAAALREPLRDHRGAGGGRVFPVFPVVGKGAPNTKYRENARKCTKAGLKSGKTTESLLGSRLRARIPGCVPALCPRYGAAAEAGGGGRGAGGAAEAGVALVELGTSCTRAKSKRNATFLLLSLRVPELK